MIFVKIHQKINADETISDLKIRLALAERKLAEKLAFEKQEIAAFFGASQQLALNAYTV